MAEDDVKEPEKDDGSKHMTQHGKDAGGNIITHKVGPLPVWGWFAVALGSYLIYRYLKNRNSSSAVVATPGATIGNQGSTYSGNNSGSSGSTTTTTSGADWINNAFQALQNLGYDNATINDALQKFAAGQPLNPTEYGIVSSAIKLIGQAPSAIGNPIAAPAPAPGPTPEPSPAPTSNGPSSGPPNLPPALTSAMNANGEHLVDTQYDPVYNEWLYLTNRGGVYALNSSGSQGSGFFGSLFSLPANVFTGTGRQAQSIRVNSGGGYTVVDTAGESYNFDKTGTGANYAASPTGA